MYNFPQKITNILRQGYANLTDKNELRVILTLTVSFVAVWSLRYTIFSQQFLGFKYTKEPWNMLFIGLIPVLLAFNSRNIFTIVAIGSLTLLAAALDIVVINKTDFDNFDAKFYFLNFCFLSVVSLCYLAQRQSRIIKEEQKIRRRRDVELSELADAYTKLEKSQQKILRLTSLIAENAPAAIAQLTPGMNYQIINPIFENLVGRVTGFLRLDLVGRSLDSHECLIECRDNWNEAIASVQSGRPARLDAEACISKITGEMTYWDWTIWPVKDEANVTESVLILGSDVTERVHSERRLATALTELEQSNHAKDTFLATLSHELRTPLTPILGWTKIIQENKYDNKTTVQGLAVIERNVRLQSQLVDDLLDLSKITMGKIELNKCLVDINELILLALETEQYSLESKNIRQTLNLSNNPLYVLGDPMRLEQVIWNILSNAGKFTPHSGNIHISTRQFQQECQIIIKDSGIGIDSDFIPYLFEPFKQADSSITRNHGGLGIGLSIASKLIELHEGQIEVQSEGKGKGAKFILKLPIQSSPNHNRSLSNRDHSQSLVEGLKVLILEDSDDSRELLGIVLSSKGCEVSLVSSVPDALRAAREFLPDIIISDIGLPEEDGYAFVRKLRAIPQFALTPIIALTGFVMDQDKDNAFSAGFDSHISKPVDPAHLIETIINLTAATRVSL